MTAAAIAEPVRKLALFRNTIEAPTTSAAMSASWTIAGARSETRSSNQGLNSRAMDALMIAKAPSTFSKFMPWCISVGTSGNCSWAR